MLTIKINAIINHNPASNEMAKIALVRSLWPKIDFNHFDAVRRCLIAKQLLASKSLYSALQ